MAFLSLTTAVVTKARDTIEPEVMTQIVTKAKEMGKLTIWWIVLKKIFYIFVWFLHGNSNGVNLFFDLLSKFSKTQKAIS